MVSENVKKMFLLSAALIGSSIQKDIYHPCSVFSGLCSLYIPIYGWSLLVLNATHNMNLKYMKKVQFNTKMKPH